MAHEEVNYSVFYPVVRQLCHEELSQTVRSYLPYLPLFLFFIPAFFADFLEILWSRDLKWGGGVRMSRSILPARDLDRIDRLLEGYNSSELDGAVKNPCQFYEEGEVFHKSRTDCVSPPNFNILFFGISFCFIDFSPLF